MSRSSELKDSLLVEDYRISNVSETSFAEENNNKEENNIEENQDINGIQKFIIFYEEMVFIPLHNYAGKQNCLYKCFLHLMSFLLKIFIYSFNFAIILLALPFGLVFTILFSIYRAYTDKDNFIIFKKYFIDNIKIYAKSKFFIFKIILNFVSFVNSFVLFTFVWVLYLIFLVIFIVILAIYITIIIPLQILKSFIVFRKMFVIYIENVYSIISSLLLSYHLYIQSIKMKENEIKFVYSMIIFFSVYLTILLNFLFLVNKYHIFKSFKYNFHLNTTFDFFISYVIAPIFYFSMYINSGCLSFHLYDYENSYLRNFVDVNFSDYESKELYDKAVKEYKKTEQYKLKLRKKREIHCIKFIGLFIGEIPHTVITVLLILEKNISNYTLFVLVRICFSNLFSFLFTLNSIGFFDGIINFFKSIFLYMYVKFQNIFSKK